MEGPSTKSCKFPSSSVTHCDPKVSPSGSSPLHVSLAWSCGSVERRLGVMWLVTTRPRKQPDLCSMWRQKTKIYASCASTAKVKQSFFAECSSQPSLDSYIKIYHLSYLLSLGAFAAPCTLCSVSFHSLSTRDPLYPLSQHHLSFGDSKMQGSGLLPESWRFTDETHTTWLAATQHAGL